MVLGMPHTNAKDGHSRVEHKALGVISAQNRGQKMLLACFWRLTIWGDHRLHLQGP